MLGLLDGNRNSGLGREGHGCGSKIQRDEYYDVENEDGTDMNDVDNSRKSGVVSHVRYIGALVVSAP